MKTRSLLLSACVLVAGASAHGAIVSYEAVLTGTQEVPVVVTPGIGFGQVDIDTTAHTLRVRAVFSGLIGNTTASHIHAATLLPFAGNASVATQTPSFSGFPLGVTAGAYDMTFDTSLASTWNAPFITANGGTALGAEAAMASALAAGKAYLNIHSSVFGGGEIRGYMAPVPAPAAGGVFALAGMAAARRRRR